MKRFLLTLLFASLLPLAISTPAHAEMLLFVDADCPHCQRLDDYLSEKNFYAKFDIQSYEITNSKENLALYVKSAQDAGNTSGGVPLLIDGQTAIEGTDPIENYLADLAGPSQALPPTKISSEDSQKLNELISENLATPRKNWLWLPTLLAIALIAHRVRKL